jgi:cold-inducible RNA-binding protein
VKLVTNVFLGNLDITVTEHQLQELFAPYGTVESVTIVTDRDTGEPRGIAFVEITQATQAQRAIAALDGTMLNGRPMRVNEARPKLQTDPARDSASRDHRRHRT